MVAWLYFVQSNGEYHNLMSFLLNGKDFSGISYLVFKKNMRSIDGRVAHTSRGYLLAVNFLSHASNLGARLDGVGLDSNSLVDLHEIVCEDDDPLTKAITITESAKSFMWEKELERFTIHERFRFSDGSTLTIPLICLKKFYPS